jgi:hypothetical protein
MQEPSDAGLPLWPDATKRYAPDRFAEAQALEAQVTPDDREAAQRWVSAQFLCAKPPWYDWAERGRQKVGRANAAKLAALTDVLRRCEGGELTARGTLYEHGKPVRSGDVKG